MFFIEMETPIFKDVVIIGNGPSAITLSYMLAGNWPFYNGLPHPIDFLQNRLEESKEQSITEQDLCSLSEGLEGRSSNPVSVLFDVLNHPEADLGIDHPSVLTWQKNPDWEVDHVVLGKGYPGGSWQKMDGSTLTISLGSWMELPNLSIREWDSSKNRLRQGQSGFRQKRATVGTVAKYYRHYVESQGLSQYFVNNATVTSVSKVDQYIFSSETPSQHSLWEVHGHVIADAEGSVKEEFHYLTPHVVLATGNSDQPNKLHVDGEDLPFVFHSLREFEDLVQCGALSPSSGNLLIVGAGLSAADAVIAARFHGIPTIHVFRRAVHDRELIFNKLPQNIYPEYHKVHQMMQDSNQDHYGGYKAFPEYCVGAIRSDRTVILSPCRNEGVSYCIQVSYVLVLIGMHPDLSFLPCDGFNLGISSKKPTDCKNNPADINLYSHESINYPGIFVVGPLVGDNFVRFVQGGSLAVVNHIRKEINSPVE